MEEFNLIKEFEEQMAEISAQQYDKGFVAGMEWIANFMILELQFQGLHSPAQHLKVFVESKKEEFKNAKISQKKL